MSIKLPFTSQLMPKVAALLCCIISKCKCTLHKNYIILLGNKSLQNFRHGRWVLLQSWDWKDKEREATERMTKNFTHCASYLIKSRTPSPYFTTILATFWRKKSHYPKNVSFFIIISPPISQFFEVHTKLCWPPKAHTMCEVFCNFFGDFPK